MQEVTGMLHCRVLGESWRPGREKTHVLISVVGVLSVPKDVIENDQLLKIAGDANAAAPGAMNDMRTQAAGTLGKPELPQSEVLSQPIWQV